MRHKPTYIFAKKYRTIVKINPNTEISPTDGTVHKVVGLTWKYLVSFSLKAQIMPKWWNFHKNFVKFLFLKKFEYIFLWFFLSYFHKTRKQIFAKVSNFFVQTIYSCTNFFLSIELEIFGIFVISVFFRKLVEYIRIFVAAEFLLNFLLFKALIWFFWFFKAVKKMLDSEIVTSMFFAQIQKKKCLRMKN